jgi:hypothetical protein
MKACSFTSEYEVRKTRVRAAAASENFRKLPTFEKSWDRTSPSGTNPIEPNENAPKTFAVSRERVGDGESRDRGLRNEPVARK